MNPVTKAHRVTTAIAVFFIVVLGVAIYTVMQEEQPESLTAEQVQAIVNEAILTEGHPDTVTTVEGTVVNFDTDPILEYDYKTTITSVNIGQGQNLYETFIGKVDSSWRLREWISINQSGSDVTFGILWERERTRPTP